jgi:recombination protein RecT
MEKEEKGVAVRQNTGVENVNKTGSERFTDMVIREFQGSSGQLAVTAFQKRLMQNYFISLDQTLKMAEEKRLKKTGKWQDPVPITWANINMDSLAVHVVACARIGFDPAQPNHINMVPFKNNTTGKYDIGFIEGYRGKELKAMKYGLDVPSQVIIEIVYSNDKFTPIKKDKNNPVETYTFDIGNGFERGDIIGGFYYHLYSEMPSKNKLVIVTPADIEKRKPEKASAEFWGGKKDKWEDGKKVGTEDVAGWFPEMVYKTIYRMAYNDITIDSQKIDDDFVKLALLENEAVNKMEDPRMQIAGNANTGRVIDITQHEPEPEPEPMQIAAEVVPEQQEEKPELQMEVEKPPKTTGKKGPGF